MLSKEITTMDSKSLSYIEFLERRVAYLESQLDISNKDWDNATLMKEWGISLRTTFNHRKNGLCYYKRGGRVFYTPKAREAFIKQGKI